jgi:tetratricopeptide (TPR) repeat protein
MPDEPTLSRPADTDRPANGATPSASAETVGLPAHPPVETRDPAPVFAPPGYELLEEIGRGGMGIVYRARELALNRHVALKILHSRYPVNGPAVRRFVDEAGITGQLQHPGIPPVHQIGTLPDGRPFLAMKLIRGSTLEALLHERAAPVEDRGRFIAAFEQVCHAVGYAHAHNVIHRDLKPANVMVGNFAEVQVMDWGLAKTLTGEHPARPPATEGDEAPGTEIRSLRDLDSATQVGSILGTPAFMPPEQAGGEVEKVDARSDVFGLGAILCVILTGEPPYVAKDAEALRLMAIRGQLAEGLARLDACGAEPELVALCKRCLSERGADRPTDAGEVAKAVAGFRAEAAERARQAEIQRARAEVAAAEQRKRRRVQMALACAVAGLAAAGGLGLWWADRTAAERRREREVTAERERLAAEAAAERGRLAASAGTALAADLRDKFRFAEAQIALDQARGQIPEEAAEARAALARAQDELTLVRELDTIRLSRFRADARKAATSLPGAYRAAFAARGIDPTSPDPGVRRPAVQWVTGCPIRLYLVAAIDDWAMWDPDEATRDRLLALTREADPGQWSDRLRSKAAWWNQRALAQLAGEVDVAALPPHLFVILYQMQSAPWTGSRAELIAAANRHRNDFWVQMEAGYYFTIKDVQPALAAGYLRAALALRPDRGYPLVLLASSVARSGDSDSSLELYREVVRIDPEYGQAHFYLGAALYNRGETAEAIKCLTEAIRLDPDSGDARYYLGQCKRKAGDTAGAIAEWQEGLRRQPTGSNLYRALAEEVRTKGDGTEELAVWQAAVRANPQQVWAWEELALFHTRRGDRPAVTAVWRAAADANPSRAWAHSSLGTALRQNGDIRRAITAYCEAVRLEPEVAFYHALLGNAYQIAGDSQAAVESFQKAVRLQNSTTNRNLLAAAQARAARDRIAPPPREVNRP